MENNVNDKRAPQGDREYNVDKAFRNYLGASVLTVATTQVANIVDASIVGNLIGSEALAAVNVCNPLLQAIFAISCLFVASGTMLTGMAIGKGDRAMANSQFSFSLILAVVIGLTIIAVGSACFGGISQLLCCSDTLQPLVDDYMWVTLLSAVPLLMMLTLHQYVTVDGSPRIITRAVVAGNLVNLGLDVVFIKYCEWGIAGAAWATFVMYVVCVLMVLPHFRKQGTLRLCLPRRTHLQIGRLLTLGLPLFFATVLLSVQLTVNNHVASKWLGDAGLVALAVCMQMLLFSMIILTGTLRTIQPIGSILRGQDNHRGMRQLMFLAYRFMIMCLIVYVVAIVMLPTQISHLLGVTDDHVMPVVLAALPPFSLNILMQVLMYCLLPVYQLYDHKYLAMFLSIGQTLLPMVGFWLLHAGWIGFFYGQLSVAVVILACTTAIRHHDKRLSWILLIPKEEKK